ncbi:MAG: response regulator transcription factor [Fimbriimonadaceae bacterium]|nr:response regulator transcription factor [Fimbriimonadaceae bacterium]
MAIRVLLADDHQLLREGIRGLLAQAGDMQVVGEAEDGREAQRLARELRPDVVVIDITMPNLNGTEATRQILEASPQTKVVALSMHSDRRSVAGMLQAGAAAYVLKSGAFRDLVLAIQAVHGGQMYLSPRVAGTVVNDYLKHLAPAADSSPSLSPREREVVQLIAEGLTTKDIAERLFLSEKTIQTHRQNVMNKLGLHTATALTKYAVLEGLTPPEP